MDIGYVTMRLPHTIAFILISLLAFACRSAQPIPVSVVPCEAVKDSRLTAAWKPRSLAGEYRVEWMSDTLSPRRIERFRLFLWLTSMNDSSVERHIKPARADTAVHPLFGVMLPDTGHFSRASIAKLRAGVDPIYPPVLLIAMDIKNPPMPERYWTALLIGTVGNRRDGVMWTDGAGLGMWVREADATGFRGTFDPWGIVTDDKGHYCAQRISH
jgi:hypothetical protein